MKGLNSQRTERVRTLQHLFSFFPGLGPNKMDVGIFQVKLRQNGLPFVQISIRAFPSMPMELYVPLTIIWSEKLQDIILTL